MANINIYKQVIARIFMLALNVLDILKFEMFALEILGQAHIRNGHIRLQISTSIKVIIEHFR